MKERQNARTPASPYLNTHKIVFECNSQIWGNELLGGGLRSQNAFQASKCDMHTTLEKH